MIPSELREFIEQNCSGKEPSELVIDAIGKKIEQLGANADEVLEYVEKCIKEVAPKHEYSELERKSIVERINQQLHWVHYNMRSASDYYYSDRGKLQMTLAEIRSLHASDSQLQNLADMAEKEIEKSDAIFAMNRATLEQRKKRRNLIIALFGISSALLIGFIALTVL